MNNQHLFIDDFVEMKKWNLAVRHYIANRPMFIGLSNVNDATYEGSIVKDITINFQWTLQIDSANNPIRGSFQKYGYTTFKNPIVKVNGDPLILQCGSMHIMLSHTFAEVFKVQEILARYNKIYHRP